MVMMTTTTTATATIDRIVFSQILGRIAITFIAWMRPMSSYVAHYVVVVSVCIYLPVTHVGEAFKNG